MKNSWFLKKKEISKLNFTFRILIIQLQSDRRHLVKPFPSATLSSTEASRRTTKISRQTTLRPKKTTNLDLPPKRFPERRRKFRSRKSSMLQKSPRKWNSNVLNSEVRNLNIFQTVNPISSDLRNVFLTNNK